MLIRTELGQLRYLIGDNQIYNVTVTANVIFIILFRVTPIIFVGFGNLTNTADFRIKR